MTVERKGKLNGAEAKLENAIKMGLIDAAKIVAQRARRKSPIDQGRLKRSLHHSDPRPEGSGLWVIDVGSNVEYARAHELGSGLHATVGEKKRIPISAKNAKALAFAWPNAPDAVKNSQKKFPLVFYRSVMHPGIRPTPYLQPALDESRDVIKGLIVKHMVAALT